jgi:predicted ATPase with chaperone activity
MPDRRGARLRSSGGTGTQRSMLMTDVKPINDKIIPAVPETLEETGLPESVLEQLILKIMYFRGDMYGRDLSLALGLQYSVIYKIIDYLKLQHILHVKRSLGYGDVSALFSLTDSGRSRAHEALEFNSYAGTAPVPLAQYEKMVQKQRPPAGWLTKEMLEEAYKGVVVTPEILSGIGHAVSSGNSFLLYGKPGNGKTFLAENLTNLDSAPVYLPNALECQGNIIQFYDPVYHQKLAEGPAQDSVTSELAFDGRWVRCKRPFLMTGGELSLDMLDLTYNPVSKIYDAPFQLKANNGIYLIDDFGRQRATPAEVLNRWIVPMERKIDFLSFRSGGKMAVPFDAFLVFSTNLNPERLGDEAFLRRIQYKMLLRGPEEAEFEEIFRRYCQAKKLLCPSALVSYLLERHYQPIGKPMRRCHPRDILSHAIDLMHFEKLPYALNEEVIDRAFESCFVQDAEEEDKTYTPVVTMKPMSAAYA